MRHIRPSLSTAALDLRQPAGGARAYSGFRYNANTSIMYRHILIPTNGSDTALKAIEAGIEFARDTGALVTFFTAVPAYVAPHMESSPRDVISLEEHNERSKRKARSVLRTAVEMAISGGVACDSDYAQSDRPYEAIIEAANRHGCDAIFIASHARKGLQAMLHPSETIQVLTHSGIPTLVYR
jgi:nucleotide-binding universal stress UspA family protein